MTVFQAEKEYDLNITATQIITIRARSEDAAVEKAFYDAFGHGRGRFAITDYEVVGTKEIKK